MANRIKIFATGTHKTASVQKSWNLDDLQTIVSRTAAESPDSIPITIHHPKNDLPVFGYADKNSLKIENDGARHVLTIEVKDFAKPFVDFFKQSGLNKVSVGLNANKALKHIGLVERPAVEGLGYAFETVAGADTDEVYEFSEPQSFTDMTQEMELLAKEKADLEKRLAALQAEKAATEAKLKDAEMESVLNKFFSEEAKGRLTPKAEAHLRRVMKAVATSTEYEFTEDDGKVVKTTPFAELQAFIKSLPVIYQSGEQATAAHAAGAEFAKTDYAKMTSSEVKKLALKKLKGLQ